jgi:hypothetical protein
MTVALERFASGAWLTPSTMTFAAVMMLGGTIAALGVLIFTANGTVDLLGRPLGTDFSSFWTAGHMALEGHAAQTYDWAAHYAVQRRIHGIEMFFPWSYPPVFLLVAAMLASLPYLPALFVWQGATLLGDLAVFWAILPNRRALLIALGFPAILICWGHGQTGFLTAALLTGGVLALPSHEVRAGILFGLLSYKPQLGLLIPFVLVAGGYWRAFVAAGATVVATVALTLTFWGWPVWQAFFDSLTPTRTIVLETGDTGFEKFQSAFAWLRLWGASVSVAYGLQAFVSVGVAAGCIWIWRSRADHRLKGAALLTGALLSSPYVLDYDLVVFGMALALLVAHGLHRGFYRWEKSLLALGWFVPVCARTIAGTAYMPLGFFTLVAIFALTMVRGRSSHDVSTSSHTPGLGKLFNAHACHSVRRAGGGPSSTPFACPEQPSS